MHGFIQVAPISAVLFYLMTKIVKLKFQMNIFGVWVDFVLFCSRKKTHLICVTSNFDNFKIEVV